MLILDQGYVNADGIDGVEVKVRVTDQEGNGLSDQRVEFSISPDLGFLTDDFGMTDIFGEFKTRYVGPDAKDLGDERNVTITARDTTLSGPDDTDDVEVHLRTHSLSLSISPWELTADGSSTATLTIVARGFDGGPAAFETISLRELPNLGGLGDKLPRTDASGRAEVVYTATTSDAIGANGTYVTIDGENINHYATATTRVFLRPLGPEITKVWSDKTGVFLAGISTPNQYHAEVNWHGDPGYVEFDLNGGINQVNASGSEVTYTYDMGRDFNADVSGGGNVLTITAFSKDGKQRSQPEKLTPFVVDIPRLIALPFSFVYAGETFNAARYKSVVKFPEPAYEAAFVVPGDYWFSGESGVKKAQIAVEGEYFSEGAKGSCRARARAT